MLFTTQSNCFMNSTQKNVAVTVNVYVGLVIFLTLTPHIPNLLLTILYILILAGNFYSLTQLDSSKYKLLFILNL